MKFSPEFPGSQGKMINNKLRTSHHQEKETSVPQISVDLCMPGLKQELEEDKIWNKRERIRGKKEMIKKYISLFFLRKKKKWNFLTKTIKCFAGEGTKGSAPGCVFLLCSPFLLMFFWLSKQRGNLTHSCRHAFMTTFSWPITLSGSFWHLSRVERQAIGPGYEVAVATAQVERWQVQGGLQVRANSLRTKCAGTFDLWKSSPG